MTRAPTLSIVVLNYNYGRYLPTCLKSILDQTFRDIDVVVIDDCSTDSSVQVVAPFLSDERLTLHSNATNLGFRRSLILGTEKLTLGEFVTVISADDLVLRSDAFALQVSLLRANPEAAFCFSDIDFVRENEVVGQHRSFEVETTLGSEEALRALLLRGDVWPLHSGTIIRRAAYERSGGYRRDLAMVLDLAIWLALAMEEGFTYVPEKLYGYRVHESQMSASPPKIRAAAREVGIAVRDACLKAEQRGYRVGKLTRRVIGIHLANTAFGGDRAMARRRWIAAFREWPVATLTNQRLAAMLVRSFLGEDATRRIRNMLRGVWGVARRA